MSQATPLLRVNATSVPTPAPRTSHVQQDTWTAWLTDIPRRIGNRLFLACDDEACWRGWETTQTWAGLGRSYRDPRFNTRLSALRADPPDSEQDGAR